MYRIEGLASFATSGPMSDPVKAMERQNSTLAPYDVKLEYLGQARMKISWKTSELDKDIKGFKNIQKQRKAAGICGNYSVHVAGNKPIIYRFFM